MIKFFQIYIAFIKQQLKSLMEYKVDFLMGVIGIGFEQIATFMILFAVFTQIKTLETYNFNEILFFYGYSQILRGIDHIYNDRIWNVGWSLIRNGEFSKYLIRPINIIQHIVFEKFNFDGFGELILGIFIFLVAKNNLGLKFSISDNLAFFVFLISGLVIYFSIKLIFSAVAFWTISSGELMSLTYEMNSFTKYPLDIYRSRLVKFILVYILPFAVVSYLPMVYFIRDISTISPIPFVNLTSKNSILIFTVSIAIAIFLFSQFVWSKGLKRYEATGT